METWRACLLALAACGAPLFGGWVMYLFILARRAFEPEFTVPMAHAVDWLVCLAASIAFFVTIWRKIHRKR